jgi:hypothetical protein
MEEIALQESDRVINDPRLKVQHEAELALCSAASHGVLCEE